MATADSTADLDIIITPGAGLFLSGVLGKLNVPHLSCAGRERRHGDGLRSFQTNTTVFPVPSPAFPKLGFPKRPLWSGWALRLLDTFSGGGTPGCVSAGLIMFEVN